MTLLDRVEVDEMQDEARAASVAAVQAEVAASMAKLQGRA